MSGAAVPDLDRRRLLQAVPAALLGSLLPRQAGAAGGSLGIAYTSFVVRLRQGARPGGGPALPAPAFVDLCKSFGADGGQMDVAQLESKDASALAALRRRLDESRQFLELSVEGKYLEDADRYAELASVARALGVTRLRVALLRGRRYEDFKRAEDWEAFAAHWRKTLPRAKGFVEKHGLAVGIENHKDFRTNELIELLGSVGSRLVGACVDFGNNVAFLEDPLATAEKLAPFAITTHLKDMAVRPYDQGFELSEVPLGTGFLPLEKMVAVLRKSRPDIPLCLEMMTRDPLKVPYLDDGYWTTFGGRDEAKIERFRAHALSKAWAAPLPRVTHLPPAEMLAAEDDNVRKCLAYARSHLGV
jgi:sugar phosphate isomerase/epimerase